MYRSSDAPRHYTLVVSWPQEGAGGSGFKDTVDKVRIGR